CLSRTNSPEEFARAFSQVAREMQKSSYPSIRKCYADVRAVDQIYYAYGTNAMSMPVLAEIWPLVGRDLNQTIQDQALPPDEAYEVCREALHELTGSATDYAQAYSSIEGTLLNNWPNEPAIWLLKGEAC